MNLMRAKIRGKRLAYILLTLILGTAAVLLITKLVRRPVFSKAAKTRHLIVISIDALNAKDFDIIKDMPNFKELINNGSYANYANELNEPGINDQHWYWYKKYV